MLIAVLGLALTTSAIACPLWTASAMQPNPPCSKHSDSTEQCPLSICQAASPFLISAPGLNLPAQEAACEPIEFVIPGTALAEVFVLRAEIGSPPDIPLFLQLHSLLI